MTMPNIPKLPPLQAGMSNVELAAAFTERLPGVKPTDGELSAFAVGAEVGFARAIAASAPATAPIDMVLHCPKCGMQHIDAPEFNSDRIDPFPAFGDDPAISWRNPPHRSHKCHNPACGYIWRPADVETNGVAAVKTKGKNDSPIAAPATAGTVVPALDTLKIVVRDAFMSGLSWMLSNHDEYHHKPSAWNEAADWFVTQWVDSENNPLHYHECSHPSCGCDGHCAADDANDRIVERLRFYAAAPAPRQDAGCPVCGEKEALTGACGGGRCNPSALCYQGSPAPRQDESSETAAEPVAWNPTDAELYDVARDFDECKTYNDIINFGREMLRRAATTPAPSADVVLTDERCDEIANECYTALRSTGWNGGMGGLKWDRALIRAALAAPGKEQP